jgi:hypothetical protein
MTDDLRALAAQLLAESPFAMPIEEAQAHIKERRARLLAQAAPPPAAEPDFSPAPMPDVQDPINFGTAFWAKRAAEPPNPKKQKRPPGRKPSGALDARHNRFGVVPGGKDDVDNDR